MLYLFPIWQLHVYYLVFRCHSLTRISPAFFGKRFIFLKVTLSQSFWFIFLILQVFLLKSSFIRTFWHFPLKVFWSFLWIDFFTISSLKSIVWFRSILFDWLFIFNPFLIFGNRFLWWAHWPFSLYWRIEPHIVTSFSYPNSLISQ